MSEMPDVLTGEVIASEWGNDIRDRTLQRYATAAQRTTEHATPAEGDQSYLEDSNSVWVYDGAAWLLLGPNLEVDGSVEVVGPVTLTGAGVSAATVALTIPTTWASWKCEAYATGSVVGGSGATFLQVRIDGTDQASLPLAGSHIGPVAIGGRRTGLTTTGSRSISLRATNSSGGQISSIYLYARAVRTS